MAKSKTTDSLSKGWHPSFRDAASLPDIKAVRTSFFLSAISITMALTAALFVGYREYQIHAIGSNIEKLRSDVTSQKSKHTAILTANVAFIKESKRVDELNEYLSKQLVASDFIFNLGKQLDKRMALRSLSAKSDIVTIEGSIAASAEESPAILEAYRTRLISESVAQSLFDSIETKSLERSTDLNSMLFTMILEKKKTAVAPVKGKAGNAH